MRGTAGKQTWVVQVRPWSMTLIAEGCAAVHTFTIPCFVQDDMNIAD